MRKNGTYRADDILRAAFVAAGDPQAGAAWMLDLASVAPDSTSLLTQLAGAKWLAGAARDPIYQQLLARLEERAGKTEGLAHDYAGQELGQWQRRYARYLIDQKQYDRAAAILDSMAKQELAIPDGLELRFRIAVERKQFDALIEQYRAIPEQAPATETLRQAARLLQRDGQSSQARAILEYVFGQEIAAHQLSAANMLGLAEFRLKDGDTPGAIELLRRLTLVVGQPFENLDAAGTLLAGTGHHAEAVEFLAKEVQGAPWDTHAQLRLAQEQLAASPDNVAARTAAEKLARDSHSRYANRLEAASLLVKRNGSTLGSGELDAVARGSFSPDLTDKPYFYTARIKAAEKSTTADTRLRLLENAVSDTPEIDSARVPLFLTLISAGREQLALSAFDSVLRSGVLTRGRLAPPAYETGVESEEETSGDSETSGTVNDGGGALHASSRWSTSTDLQQASVADRAALLVEVAKANAKLEEFQAAQSYLRMASRMDIPKPLRADIDRELAALRAVVRRNASNARRMPAIHPELEQDHLVRQRLVARAQGSAGVSPAGSVLQHHGEENPPARRRRYIAKGGRAQ